MSLPFPYRTYSRHALFAIAVCFVLSGATGLIYEVLWARMLGLVFGATTFAISAVLAAFMGGLALGSAFGGRFADRIRRPFLGYGLLEIGIALYALAVPAIFRLADLAYVVIWTQTHPGFYTFNVWRFVLSCAVLLIPTTLMGATLPVLSAAILRSPSHKSTSIARLYNCNLAGAIIGTLIAGFVLLPYAGVRATIWTAAMVNVVIGLVAIAIDRREVGRTEAGHSLSDAIDDAVNGNTSTSVEPAGIAHTRFWLFCAAVSGFVTISTQVAWTRILTMVIGSSTYAFSLVVALFILGLSIGAFIVGRRRSEGDLRTTIVRVELLGAASLVLSLALVNKTPDILISLGLKMAINSWFDLLALQALIAAMLLVVPAVLMGMVMPLVLVWAANATRGSSALLVGRSYAINTLGAIAGAFCAGFVLIPKGSTRFTILFAAALCIIVAAYAYQPKSERVDGDLHRGFKVAVTSVLIVALFVSAPSLNLAALSIGAYDSVVRVLAKTRSLAPADDVKDRGAQQGTSTSSFRLLKYIEGPTATVSVSEIDGIRFLAINGRTNASDRDDMPTQVMVGLLPMLIAPKTENGLMVGLASGVSAGSMLQSPLSSLECVELEPTTREASAYFNHVNNRPLEDPRLRLIFDDARTYLNVTAGRYDIIVSEPSHPWVPGVANLFTQEFFNLAKGRLADQGVFVQWVQIYQLSTESLRSVLATYQSVFPHVLMFRVGGAAKGKDLILIGSNSPIDFSRMTERMRDPRVAAEMARVGMSAEADVMAWYVCDERQLAPALSGAAINTDDNMRVENRAPREAFLPLMEGNSAWIDKLQEARRQSRHPTTLLPHAHRSRCNQELPHPNRRCHRREA